MDGDRVTLEGCAEADAAETLVRHQMADDYLRHGLTWDSERFHQRFPERCWRWAVCDRGRVGLLAWEQSADVVVLRELHVVPDERGKGIGTHLLALWEDMARLSGAQCLRLRVLSGSRAVSWYQRQGYQQVRGCPTPHGQVLGLEKAVVHDRAAHSGAAKG
ncbi:GNAT family N-acetyltransferase [Halomonas sp. DP5Y7-2]|uniref:GNAT family N-acetyltransferase n=1 Tax=Halomonas sp. DP5Y7-2 TaxID=2859076 RepID=UPI001C99FC0D|nr:GNAT family N-acetyltransferase [Halomonas sp. DP5Y7-2]MBY5986079.1 GNAT family N-acetyltransferase [Halomonas sp. DP5Y7-2]MED5293914.1 GNAT family N-acetyltransferase [Pseudomonadota bacterium]